MYQALIVAIYAVTFFVLILCLLHLACMGFCLFPHVHDILELSLAAASGLCQKARCASKAISPRLVRPPPGVSLLDQNSPSSGIHPPDPVSLPTLPSKQFRLFQVGTGWFPETKGGTENIFYHLFESLGAEGVAVRGLVSGAGQAERDTGGRMTSFAVDGRPLLRRALAIRAAARRAVAANPPDVVASHFALYALPFLDRLRGVPLVTHFHGPWALESQVEGASRSAIAAKMLVERLVYNRSARVIAMSDAFRHILLTRYRVPDRVVRTVPNGVDAASFDIAAPREEARQRLGWEAGLPTFFTVRRLVRRMGLDRLLDAWATVRQQPRGREAVLHIAGTGPERAALERQAAELGLLGSVRFDGFVSDEALRLAYRAADVTLVPTAALEGFGLVAAESLAAGTPVLTTPVGGLPEVVSGLSAAMVLRGADAGSIAAGIAEVLADASMLPDAGSCREYARRTYDWRVIAPLVAAVYREVL